MDLSTATNIVRETSPDPVSPEPPAPRRRKAPDMKAVYLLPCSCGQKVPVDAGQAGAKIACSCGQQLNVPTFRALRELEQIVPVAAAAVESGGGWNAIRGMMFSFGLLVSLVAAVCTCYHLYMFSQLLDGGESWKQSHLQEMELDVDYMAPADALADFQSMATKGLTIDGVPPWSHVAELRDSSRRWLIGELIALAIGLVSLAASLIGIRPARPR